MSQKMDYSGNDLVIDQVYVGASTPGAAGTLLAGSELTVLDGVTAGTATASKAVVLGASKEIATITTLTATTINATTLALAAGGKVDLDSAAATLSSNAATLTKWAGVITSEALTTAAGASQAFTLTLSGVAAGDLAFVQAAGGTNTRKNYTYEAVTTTNTVTVTVYNNEPTNAINGTLIFNLLVAKA